MAGTATNAVQAAFISTLTADATLKGLLATNALTAANAAVFDEPPEGQTFPYAVVDPAVENQDNRMGGTVGKDLTVSIHVWSEARGYSQTQTALDRIEVLLDNNLSLSVTGYTLNLLNVETTNLYREGIVRHGVANYRVMVVEA